MLSPEQSCKYDAAITPPVVNPGVENYAHELGKGIKTEISPHLEELRLCWGLHK
jgi:hypothetical protein